MKADPDREYRVNKIAFKPLYNGGIVLKFNLKKIGPHYFRLTKLFKNTFIAH
jgi:hypothetical protein